MSNTPTRVTSGQLVVIGIVAIVHLAKTGYQTNAIELPSMRFGMESIAATD